MKIDPRAAHAFLASGWEEFAEITSCIGVACSEQDCECKVLAADEDERGVHVQIETTLTLTWLREIMLQATGGRVVMEFADDYQDKLK